MPAHALPLPIALLLLLILAAVPTGLAQPPSTSPPDDALRQPWLNAQLIAWDGNIHKHHRLARALGYGYVVEARQRDYPGDPQPHPTHSRGLGFYLNDPHKEVQVPMGLELDEARLGQLLKRYPHTFAWYPSLPRGIDEQEIAALRKQDPEVFEQVRAAFEANMAWANDQRPFPDNLAQLQRWGDGRRWEPCPDFQQQAVIDRVCRAIVAFARRAERPDLDYRFAGLTIDVIELWEEFSWQSNRPLPGKPSTKRSSVAHRGVTHQYATLQEGWFVFLGQLRDELEAAFPDRAVRFIWEPTPIVANWIEPLDQADYPSLTPRLRRKILGDALLDEKPGMQYLTDAALQQRLPLSRLGTSSGDFFTGDPHYPTQLAYLGETNARGAYFLSYGTFDRSRRDIDTYPPQFTLIRALSAWQNMLETPVDQRTWDAQQQVYASPTAYADAHALAGLRHDTRQLYGVLLDEHAALHLAPGRGVVAAHRVNAFWEPTGSDPEIQSKGGVIRPSADAQFPVAFIAQLDPPDTADALRPAPGRVLHQDKSRTQLPNARLLNPGFEDGIQGWFGTGEARLTAVDSPAAEGRHALRVDRRSLNWHALAQDVTSLLMNDRQGRYRVRASVRPAEGTGQFQAVLQFRERGELIVRATDPVTADARGWARIEQTLDLDWGDWIEGARFVIRRLDGTGAYFVDDTDIQYLP